jgi:hypothetical protein
VARRPARLLLVSPRRLGGVSNSGLTAFANDHAGAAEQIADQALGELRKGY